MKKLIFTLALVSVAFSAATVFGATKRKVQAMSGNDDGPETTGRAAKILVDQIQLGQNALATAPCIGGLQQFYKKPRQWIVLNTKYTTFGSDSSKFLEQLTFNWHVVLDTKTATENKGNKENLPPWSYFTTTVTYFNIPAGQHGASVCLPPSYRERFGEAKAVGLEISNENGDVLGWGSFSEAKPIKAGTKFWEEENFQQAMSGDKPAIARRQGLVDRSKTIFALVNPNDYEATIQ